MSAEPRSVNRSFAPLPGRMLSPLAEGRVRVLQFGPALSVRGGITSVEQLICDYLPPYVSMRHVPTMEDGSALTKVSVFARSIQILRRALESPDPAIVHIHFASRGSTLRKLILAEMVVRAGRPLVLHAHGSEFDDFHRRLPAAVRRNINSTLQRANVFITLSSQWRNFYVEECEISPSQIVVLPNPVRVPSELPARERRSHVQFLHLGRLGGRKGSYDVVQAFGSLPGALRDRARLVLAGDGDVEGVRKLAESIGPNVTVHSWIDARERDRLLGQSDVFLLPSRAEGVPMALLEAMAYGLPSITSCVGGIPDVFRGGEDGVYVTPGNVDEIRTQMGRLISDESARLAAGRAAYEHARDFDVHVYARRLAGIYQRIAPISETQDIA
jgi:glycosyltransferase involved in cell wall biosynthesis